MKSEKEIKERIAHYDRFRELEESHHNLENAYHWWLCAHELKWVLDIKGKE